jgi:hypothetical protein
MVQQLIQVKSHQFFKLLWNMLTGLKAIEFENDQLKIILF